MAGIKRFTCASAIAALSVSVPSLAQTPDRDEVETVVVTGVRESLVKGLENKRAAVQVVESIVAEDIGKLPDNNVIEALQRVTGVQVSNRGGGEADAIFIRGLNDITTTWNGRNAFTGVGRSLQLQDIPANLISTVDVYKTRAADQIETGLAGQIDVRTRRPFDLDGLQMSFAGRVTQQDQREDSMDPNLSFLVSDTWSAGDGKFGALFNVSYSRTRWRDQSITAGALLPFTTAEGAQPPGFTPLQRIFNGNPPIWLAGTERGLPTAPGSTLDFDTGPGVANFPYLLARDALFASDFEGDRERPAANVALQWAPNDTSEYTLEAFYQGFEETRFNNLFFTFVDWWNALGPDPASTIELYDGTNIISQRVVGDPFNFNSGDAFVEQTDTYVYALNGKWQIGDRLSLEADLSIQESRFDTTFIAVRTERGWPQVRLDFNAQDGIPSWHFTDPATGANIDERILDAGQWNMGQLFQNAGTDIGGAQTFAVDGDFQLGGEGETFEKLSFGLRYDDRDAVHRQPLTVAAPFLPMGATLADMPEGMYWNNEDFYDGTSLIPNSWAVVNGYYLADHAGEVRTMYGQAAEGPEVFRSYEVEERTQNAYVQVDMNFGEKFHAQAGVRYSKVTTPIEFNDLVNIANPPDAAVSEVDDFMPSITLRYDVTDNFRLRANYGETLRRPDFVALNPNFTLVEDLTNIGYGTGTGGNPDLEAAKGKNIDLTFEWYFAEDSAVYGTWFKRDIEGLVVTSVETVVIPIAVTGLNTDTFQVSRPLNASNGEMDGIELGFLYFPDYLPNFLKGFGLQGSFTKLDSSQNVPRIEGGVVVGQDRSAFFGVSEKSYNATLAYDRAGFGGRLSFVHRDDFLNNNEARLFANPIGIWRQPESSLDLQLNYDFADHFSVSFDIVNITEEEQKSYYAFSDAGGPDMFNFGNTFISRQYAVGFRWKN